MKNPAVLLLTTVLAACSSPGIDDPGHEEKAARNLCEAMRSYRPYYPDECGEQSGSTPLYGDPGYRTLLP